MAAYYNEIDAYAAQWLRNLIAAGHIAPGDVDERSIVDVRPDDLAGYTQCHFFAGIGGWSYAARIAGWDDDRRLWTGSCPCQPLSSAGQRKGHADERHLWPAFYGLVAECRPPVVFGEQVASADGREWLAGVRADLEALGYACGAADLCAAGVGAPHRRQRLYWLAHPANDGHVERDLGDEESAEHQASGERQNEGRWRHDTADGGHADQGLDDSSGSRFTPARGRKSTEPEGGERLSSVGRPWSDFALLDCTDGQRRASTEPSAFPLAHGIPQRVGRLRAYGNAIVPQVAAEVIGAYLDAERLAA